MILFFMSQNHVLESDIKKNPIEIGFSIHVFIQFHVFKDQNNRLSMISYIVIPLAKKAIRTSIEITINTRTNNLSISS